MHLVEIPVPVLPRLRSKLSLKLIKTAKCCSCGACTKACDFKAIKEGIPNHKCIRCLKCITICPYNALDFKQSFLLQNLFKKTKIGSIYPLHLKIFSLKTFYIVCIF